MNGADDLENSAPQVGQVDGRLNFRTNHLGWSRACRHAQPAMSALSLDNGGAGLLSPLDSAAIPRATRPGRDLDCARAPTERPASGPKGRVRDDGAPIASAGLEETLPERGGDGLIQLREEVAVAVEGDIDR